MTLIFRIWEALLHGFVVAVLLMLAFYPVCFLEVKLSSKTGRKIILPSSVALLCFCLVVMPKRIDIVSSKERKQTKDRG
ncbi:hypothetical protein ACTGW0_04015 [Streptococcus suis]